MQHLKQKKSVKVVKVAGGGSHVLSCVENVSDI